MPPATAVLPLQEYLNWCDRLGIASQAARQPVLLGGIKALNHESVLFFLCGRDYIYNPTDLKLQGIERLFIGEGTPYQINIGSGAADDVRQLLHAPGVNVHTEMLTPHNIGAYRAGATPGVRAGGAGNYNLGTQAIVKACQGLGSNFLRDMVNAVRKTMGGEAPSQVRDDRIFGYLQDMRNATRRFWMNDLREIGL